MLDLSATYLLVKDIDKSIKFYSQLLEKKPASNTLDRWAQFDLDGKSFALLNQMYDYQAIAGGQDLDKHYSKAYLNRLSKHKTVFGNNVVLRFRTKDLNKEYARVLALDIGTVSDILSVNISEPDYFFYVTDPDGNLLEISGAYSAPILSSVTLEVKEATPKVQAFDSLILKAALEKEKAAIADKAEIAKMGGNPQASFYVSFAPNAYSGGFKGKDAPLLSPSPGKGTHGYFPTSPLMRSSFMMFGKNVAKGRNVGEIDMRAIAPTLAEWLGVSLPDAEVPPLK